MGNDARCKFVKGRNKDRCPEVGIPLIDVQHGAAGKIVYSLCSLSALHLVIILMNSRVAMVRQRAMHIKQDSERQCSPSHDTLLL